MKIIDCEFHYYLPELMDYLATRDQAMRYYPETKVLEVRDKIYAHFSGVTNTYPVVSGTWYVTQFCALFSLFSCYSKIKCVYLPHQ